MKLPELQVYDIVSMIDQLYNEYNGHNIIPISAVLFPWGTNISRRMLANFSWSPSLYSCLFQDQIKLHRKGEHGEQQPGLSNFTLPQLRPLLESAAKLENLVKAFLKTSGRFGDDEGSVRALAQSFDCGCICESCESRPTPRIKVWGFPGKNGQLRWFLKLGSPRSHGCLNTESWSNLGDFGVPPILGNP